MGRRPSRTKRRIGPLAWVAAVVLIAGAVVYGPAIYGRILYPISLQSSIARHAAAAKVDPYLVAAVINVESGFRADVVSSAGAVGLMQVKPSTAKAVARSAGIPGKMNVETLSDPETNIRVGTLYLAELLGRYNGDVALALAAYNGGMTNADRWADTAAREGATLIDSIDFPETAHYVAKVGSQAAAYRRLYPGAFADVK